MKHGKEGMAPVDWLSGRRFATTYTLMDGSTKSKVN